MNDWNRTPVIIDAARLVAGDVVAGYFLHDSGTLHTLPTPWHVVAVAPAGNEWGRPGTAIDFTTTRGSGGAVHASDTRMLVLRTAATGIPRWQCEECRTPWANVGQPQCHICGNRTRTPRTDRT